MNGFINGIMWLFRCIFLILIGYFIILNNYDSVNVMVIAFILSFFDIIVLKVFKVKMNDLLTVSLIIFIFCAQCLGTSFDFYGKFYWWDDFLHFFSGVIFFYVGLFVYNLISKTNTNKLLCVFFGILFSFSVITCWEIFEFIMDCFLGLDMQRARLEIGRAAIYDTMIDMILAVIGTFVGVFINIRKTSLD